MKVGMTVKKVNVSRDRMRWAALAEPGCLLQHPSNLTLEAETCVPGPLEGHHVAGRTKPMSVGEGVELVTDEVATWLAEGEAWAWACESGEDCRPDSREGNVPALRAAGIKPWTTAEDGRTRGLMEAG